MSKALFLHLPFALPNCPLTQPPTSSSSLQGGQDYFTHMAGAGYDFHIDKSPECGEGCSQIDWDASGVYSTHIFTSSAVKIINAHAGPTPLFLYLAFQAVHSPDQVPPPYEWPYNTSIPADAKRKTFAGMLSALDEGVGNVTAALSAAGMLDNTVIIFVADNGGPVACSAGICGDHTGTSNFPLRGGKHSLWEGGTRLMALVSAPLLHARGTNHTGLMHHADWLPTLLEAAGVSYTPAPGFELHGVSQWASLTTGTPSPRNETVLNIDPAQPMAPPYQGNAAIVTAEGWKLHLGMPGPPWAWSPANSSAPGLGGGEGETAPLNCSSPIPGLCYPGNDLRSVTATSAEKCCSLCTAKCVGFTFRADKQLCFLKAALGKPTQDPACTSSPAGPPPAGQPLWPLNNKTVALYNVLEDEEERHEVSADHPEIVALLKARLDAWAGLMQYDYWLSDSEVDPRSNPAKRNNTWYPWL